MIILSLPKINMNTINLSEKNDAQDPLYKVWESMFPLSRSIIASNNCHIGVEHFNVSLKLVSPISPKEDSRPRLKFIP